MLRRHSCRRIPSIRRRRRRGPAATAQYRRARGACVRGDARRAVPLRPGRPPSASVRLEGVDVVSAV